MKEHGSPEKKQNKKHTAPKSDAWMAIRVLLSGYLLFLVFQLYRSISSGTVGKDIPIVIAAMVLFTVLAVVFLVTSVRTWMKGKNQNYSNEDDE